MHTFTKLFGRVLTPHIHTLLCMCGKTKQTSALFLMVFWLYVGLLWSFSELWQIHRMLMSREPERIALTSSLWRRFLGFTDWWHIYGTWMISRGSTIRLPDDCSVVMLIQIQVPQYVFKCRVFKDNVHNKVLLRFNSASPPCTAPKIWMLGPLRYEWQNKITFFQRTLDGFCCQKRW